MVGLPPLFNGYFLVHRYICDKIFMKKTITLFGDISEEICPICNVEESLKNSWIRIRRRMISKI